MDDRAENREPLSTGNDRLTVAAKHSRSPTSPVLSDKRPRLDDSIPTPDSMATPFPILAEAVCAALTSSVDPKQIAPVLPTLSDTASLPPYHPPPCETDVLRRRLQAAEFEVLCAQLKAAKSKVREYKAKNRELARRLNEAEHSADILRQLRCEAEERAERTQQAAAKAKRDAEDQIAAGDRRIGVAEARAALRLTRIQELEEQLNDDMATKAVTPPSSPDQPPPPPGTEPPTPPPPTIPATPPVPHTAHCASDLDNSESGPTTKPDVELSSATAEPSTANGTSTGKKKKRDSGSASATGTMTGTTPVTKPKTNSMPTPKPASGPNSMPIVQPKRLPSTSSPNIAQLYKLHGDVQTFLSGLRETALRHAELGHMQAPGWVKGIEGLCGLNSLYLDQIKIREQQTSAGVAGETADLEEHLWALRGVAENVQREMEYVP